MPPKNPRLSLTPAQIQAGVGAELLALCQTITADGVLTDEEIVELRTWLDAHRASDLPAIGFLVATLERILADGVVTPEERKELYAAIEKVLPPEARKEAAAQRKAVETDEKARSRAEREAVRELNRPVYAVNFMVAGVHYEGRPEIIRRHVQEDDRVYLARDPRNRYSRNAIEVRLGNGYQIGFVPEDDASEFAHLLDAGHPHAALVTKILTGGRVPIPIVQAYLYRTDASVENLAFPRDVPPKREHVSERRPSEWKEDEREEPRRARPKASGRGCLLLLPALAAPAAVAAARALGVWG